MNGWHRSSIGGGRATVGSSLAVRVLAAGPRLASYSASRYATARSLCRVPGRCGRLTLCPLTYSQAGLSMEGGALVCLDLVEKGRVTLQD